jgi:hypothetical protein
MTKDLCDTSAGAVSEQRSGALAVALTEEDLAALAVAVKALEGQTFATRLAAVAGRPIQLLGQALPQVASQAVSRATEAALTRALHYALRTIPKERADPETRIHKVLAALSGGLGGALGLSAVVVELPISTTIMLRSIARIAQSAGEDLAAPETALACLQVFALGGRSGSEHAHESGYFAVRAAMARSVTGAIQHIAGRGVIDESASAIVRLLAQIGSRFGVVVSQKVAAQAVPVVGALGGAAVNAAFIDHFQNLGPWPFHGAAPGADLRAGHRSARLRPDPDPLRGRRRGGRSKRSRTGGLKPGRSRTASAGKNRLSPARWRGALFV